MWAKPWMKKRQSAGSSISASLHWSNTVELLRVLLKTRCEAHDVAQKLVASAADLELIAADDEAPVPALSGWRRELFGEDALALLASPVSAGDAPRFDLPVACPASAGCVVRQYVDQDSGAGYADYRCGRYSYDGHRGTDIRVPDDILLSKGVAVLAAAPGVVAATRDGIADVSIREGGKEAIKDRAAGNVVLVDHR